MAVTRLLGGERHLIQTVDKKLTLTTHRVILRQNNWLFRSYQSVMLEDITSWQIKATGKSLYLAFSVVSAFFVYFNDAFALLSGFFLMLYLMTRQHRIHIESPHTTMILPIEDVEENRLNSMIELVRQAKRERMEALKQQASNSIIFETEHKRSA
ncbi:MULTISPECIES: hypothetical protein [Pontibacter]|uniref:Uncharacterized protein n=1 Tax=Pontibacter lucknowensis TaxID=1077936 RepID=A0A1N6U1Q3_9BACT|nr:MULTISPECIES: hypothetical protein [Pontibacter]EJF11726.1 hypothetical protein O71_01159 [Pontibacter sp. BAB1700]SIQ59469.1 hypothetical protein SAMN05421545_0627 [Pontibacter lucknowensis]